MKAKVGIVMGSDSDLIIMKDAAKFLEKMGIEYEIAVASAHRTPELLTEFINNGLKNGIKIFIAGAGGAAHLPGVVAAATVLPVIGVPIKSATLNGLDSLYSIVQMPNGIPVATVAINGAENAGILAVSILATGDDELYAKLQDYRASLKTKVEGKNKNLQELGYSAYIDKYINK